MPDLLETAAIARQRRALDCRENFVVRKHGVAGAGDEALDRNAAYVDPAAAAARQFQDRVMRDQRGDAVRRGRCIDDVAADRGGFAQLIVGEPDRAARHRRHDPAERRVIEKTLDRCGGTEADTGVADATLAQFGNARDIDQHRNMHVTGATLARPGQQIGGTGDQPIAPAIGFHQMKGLVERGRGQVFVAEKHGVCLAPFSLPFRGGSASVSEPGWGDPAKEPPPGRLRRPPSPASGGGIRKNAACAARATPPRFSVRRRPSSSPPP